MSKLKVCSLQASWFTLHVATDASLHHYKLRSDIGEKESQMRLTVWWQKHTWSIRDLTSGIFVWNETSWMTEEKRGKSWQKNGCRVKEQRRRFFTTQTTTTSSSSPSLSRYTRETPEKRQGNSLTRFPREWWWSSSWSYIASDVFVFLASWLPCQNIWYCPTSSRERVEA